jgi:hypothetical protein
MSFLLEFGEIGEGPLGHNQPYPMPDSRLLGPTAQRSWVLLANRTQHLDPRGLGLNEYKSREYIFFLKFFIKKIN